MMMIISKIFDCISNNTIDVIWSCSCHRWQELMLTSFSIGLTAMPCIPWVSFLSLSSPDHNREICNRFDGKLLFEWVFFRIRLCTLASLRPLSQMDPLRVRLWLALQALLISLIRLQIIRIKLESISIINSNLIEYCFILRIDKTIGNLMLIKITWWHRRFWHTDLLVHIKY